MPCPPAGQRGGAGRPLTEAEAQVVGRGGRGHEGAGVAIVAGNGTGVVAQRLAERLTRAAVVRTDLFDKAVGGSGAAAGDPARDLGITIAVTHGYASSGHPVILHGAAARGDHAQLVDELRTTGLTPVRLVDVADGEDYGEVARRLIDGE